MRKILFIVFLVFFLPFAAQAKNEQAPEIPQGLDWLNVDKPLTLAQLRGKFVLLDFWTFCCINCQHIIPDLKKLEAKYPNELVVIGVHSAKFNTEGLTENIREAVLRHGIEHPVVNDPQLATWQQYAINSWPTVVLIAPDGFMVARKNGEGIFTPMDAAIKKDLPAFADKINRTPLPLSLEKNKQPHTILNFPGKIAADPEGKRLFIADSGHNRIVITKIDGEILEIIGNGSQGRADGKFMEAEFFHPQGMAYVNNYLYIADTENHLLRRADLVNKTVTTIAGTGVQGFDRAPSGQAMHTALSSPWDIVLLDSQMYIAMAGLHQIWAMDLNRGSIRAYAGNGQENIVDGPLAESSLAQPSGITTDGYKLYFADSETSSIRVADLDPKARPQVKTIIGRGLFEFGDADGDKDMARFQHPLGIVYKDGVLFVADTYNNKIKLVDPLNRNSRSLTSGKQSPFNEPGGLAFAEGKLYVADTNNHKVRVVDLQAVQVETLDVHPKVKPMVLNLEKFVGDKHVLPPQASLKSFELDLQLEKDHQLLVPTQSFIRIFGANGQLITQAKIESSRTTLAIKDGPKDKAYIEAGIYYCRHTAQGLCLVKDILFELPLNAEGKESLNIELSLPAGTYK